MPAENMEEQGLAKVPDLELAQLKFEVANGLGGDKKLLASIKKDKMAPYYRSVCKELKWKEDSKLWSEMSSENEKELKAFDVKITDAETNLGESEHREALLAKAEYLTKIGDKDNAVEAIRKTMEKTVGLGNKMDLIFHNIRIGLFWMDHNLVKTNLDKASTLMEEGGDWDRRNRLKVYSGLYALAIRDFEKAANLFLETVSTFTSYELMDYTQFVKYAVYASMIALERRDLHKKVVKGSEILEVLHQMPKMKQYLNSLYNIQYAEFFQCLAEVEQMAKKDRYLNPHYAFYVREMKIKAFGQLLESYRSLTLTYMAEAFGITEDYMDQELSRYIADGRLHCKIDKVRGIVITNRPDSKNAQYQSTIKQGDILLNRVQKLSRVINI
eukprot:04688.XXX_258370_259664_1 [CDS] Oithona nana genome sequencing.